eukprot:scaffold10093_cov104-Isochrysis_galbana.AAC.8
MARGACESGQWQLCLCVEAELRARGLESASEMVRCMRPRFISRDARAESREGAGRRRTPPRSGRHARLRRTGADGARVATCSPPFLSG